MKIRTFEILVEQQSAIASLFEICEMMLDSKDGRVVDACHHLNESKRLLDLEALESSHDSHDEFCTLRDRIAELEMKLANARGWIMANTTKPVHDLLKSLEA